MKQSHETGSPSASALVDQAGRRWVLRSQAVDDGLVLCHYRDLTSDLGQYFGERGQLQLARIDRGVSVAKLSRALAHQLNNPMTGIIIFAEALTGALKPGTLEHEDATEITNSAHRCRELIQQFQQLSRRRRAAEASPVALAQVLADAGPLLKHRAEAVGGKLIVELPEELQVQGYLRDLEQILVALIDNATRAISRGCTITVRAEARGDRVLLSVTDDGAGIAPDWHALARAPLVGRWDGASGVDAGVGAGLATCEALAGLVDGELTIEPGPNEKGTTMRLSLPRAEAPGKG